MSPAAAATAHPGYQAAGPDQHGRQARETYHAVADQPVRISWAFGQLTRYAGDALCGAAPLTSCPAGLFPPPVTCPACRAIAAAEHVQIGDDQTTAAPAARRWPLAVIAAPAAVSIWSGWVGLGGLCGFGRVQPLPGLLPLHINTALTLPLGIESYAALALGAWLRSATSGRARTFARASALGSLVLGMAGQVSYHLLAARHATRAPDLVVVLVSCLPVIVLGCAVALLHLLGAESESAAATGAGSTAGSAPGPGPVSAPERGSGSATATARRAHPRAPAGRAGVRTRSAPVTPQDAEAEFMSELAAGALPSLRQIRARMHVGQDRARQLRAHLATQLEALVSA